MKKFLFQFFLIIVCFLSSYFLLINFTGSNLKAVNVNELPDAGHFSVLFPRYPGAITFPVGNSLQFNGQDVEIGYFQTKDSPKKAARFFFAVWTSQGYTPVLNSSGDSQSTVSVVNHKKGFQLTVSLLKNSDLTWGFPSVNPIGKSKLNSKKPRSRLKYISPVDEIIKQGENPLTTTDRSAGRVMNTYSFLMRGKKPKIIERFKESFSAYGYAGKVMPVKHKKSSSLGTVIEFKKADEDCRLHVIEDYSGLFLDKKGKPDASYIVAHCNFKEIPL